MRFLLVFLWFVSLILAGFLGWYFAKNGTSSITLNAPQSVSEKIRKYDKYSYESLMQRKFQGGEVKFEEIIEEFPEYTSWKISFKTDGDKRVEGQVNIPKSDMTSVTRPDLVTDSKYPVILMIRGSAEVLGYKTGNGTRNTASYFASQGYLTIAPDFLGFGGSDPINPDILEARFETYTTVLNLLASLQSIKQADNHRVGIWAHSNGGQIANTILEVTGREIPTSLWAPVTKPFPFSVLVYTDDLEDHGKLLISTFSDFMKDYDATKYSIENYFDRIAAPIQLHQGTGDTLVRRDWSDSYVKALKSKDKDVTYKIHPGADHNMVPAWNLAVEQDLEFYKKNLK